jgi:hypothetical protein
MPIVSKEQQRWAYWASEHGRGKTKKAAKDFVAAGPKGGSFKELPATTGGYHSGGLMAQSAGGTPGAATRRLGSLGVMGNAQHETLWGEPQYRALSGMNYEGHRYR